MTELKTKVTNFVESLEKEGFSDIMLIAVPKNNNEVIRATVVSNLNRALAVVGMMIKLIADDTNLDSVELSKEITKKLDHAEKAMKKRSTRKIEVL